MAEALEEAVIRAHLADGGAIVGAFVVARSEREFALYLRPSWVRGRGYIPLSAWRKRTDRSLRSMDGVLRWLRRFGFVGRVTIYPVGDPDLRQFSGLRACDLKSEDVSPEEA